MKDLQAQLDEATGSAARAAKKELTSLKQRVCVCVCVYQCCTQHLIVVKELFGKVGPATMVTHLCDWL